MEKQAAKMGEDLYFKLGFTPKTLMMTILAIKIIMLIFVLSASWGFYLFYQDFQNLGCAAYCKTKTTGVSAQMQYCYSNNLSHSQTYVPNSSSYQNSDPILWSLLKTN